MRSFAFAAALLLLPASALADDAGAPPPAETITGCVERIPSGGARPQITEVFPARGMSGYAATLEVTIEHGKGETVLPHGMDLQSAGDAAKELKKAGFVLPDQDGGGAARLEPIENTRPDRAKTKLSLPLVALPEKPGRSVLVLPSIPVSIARASGEVATVCTRPHTIVVDDPTASTPNARPHENPPARPQREEWTALKYTLELLSAGMLLGALVAYLVRKWLARPKPVPPPPPPRPPWEIALERLDEARHAGLLEVGRYGEYFDRVSDAVRGYLGARYGFDGLESTTDEVVACMKRATVYGIAVPEIVLFLQECDLVKFANVTPTFEECTRTLDAGEKIVKATMPVARAFGTAEAVENRT